VILPEGNDYLFETMVSGEYCLRVKKNRNKKLGIRNAAGRPSVTVIGFLTRQDYAMQESSSLIHCRSASANGLETSRSDFS
jgi:hypothetical protein